MPIRILLGGSPAGMFEVQEVIRCLAGDYDVEAFGDRWMQIRLHAPSFPRKHVTHIQAAAARREAASSAWVKLPFDDLKDKDNVVECTPFIRIPIPGHTAARAGGGGAAT